MRRKAGSKAGSHTACYSFSYRASKTDTQSYSATQKLQLIPSCLPLSVLPNKKDKREESCLNGKLEGPGESERDTQTFIDGEESAVSEWIWGGGEEHCPPALSLK